jgi:hypothetical protein
MKRATLLCKTKVEVLVGLRAALVVLAWSLGSAAKVEAGGGLQYHFTFNDGQGNSGYGVLAAIDPGLGDGSLWATSGTLDVTSGADTGTYNLLTSATTTPVFTPDGNWIFDNLIYPGNNAGSGVYNGYSGNQIIANPSLLDYFGLLFDGTLGGSTIYLNIGTVYGDDDYAFGSSSDGVVNVFTLTGGSFTLNAVPEPASLTMLGIAIACIAGNGWRRRKLATPRETVMRPMSAVATW